MSKNFRTTKDWEEALKKFRTTPLYHFGARGGKKLLAEQVSTGYEAVQEVIRLRQALEKLQASLRRGNRISKAFGITNPDAHIMLIRLAAILGDDDETGDKDA